jgi:poly-gamma-glutamate capsule biosynthesis protein CapA/YwtB (metallophosphatase superfamily)
VLVIRFYALLLFLAAGILAADVRTQPRGTRLLFTGDILLSRHVTEELQHRGISPWTPFAHLFGDSHWVSGNLEGALGSPSACIESARPCFATPDSAAQLLKMAGFHGLTLENNHAGDLGSAGRERTRKLLQEESLAAIDFENSPFVAQAGDAKIALVSITLVPPAEGRAQEIPSGEIFEKLQKARQLADLVVVSIHWGHEYQKLVDATQREQAHWLIQQGADLIVGHHPHVIQRPECIEGHPVFFSLGNHVFDQTYPPTKEGMIADCRLTGERLSCQEIRTHTARGTSFPTLGGTHEKANSSLAACAPKTKRTLDVEGPPRDSAR